MRADGRQPDEKRPVKIDTDFVRTAYGSCLIATGNTRVICTASVEETVPPFLKAVRENCSRCEAPYMLLDGSEPFEKRFIQLLSNSRMI